MQFLQQVSSYHQRNDANHHMMQQDISEMKQQIAQITELLYEYDRAIQNSKNKKSIAVSLF